MAVVNFANREITARIVYFGATGAGCNTNVRQLYDLLSSRERSRLHKFGPTDSNEISWYFDYVPLEASLAGDFHLRVRVYSLPGGIVLPAHRSEVLDQVDGVAFVADARDDQAAANLDSLLELERSLAAQGVELSALPVVLQVNHADDPAARPVDDVALDLNPYGFPLVRAVASRGEGVLETHAAISARIGRRIATLMSGGEAGGLVAEYQTEVDRDEAVVRRHLEAIRARAPSAPGQMLGSTEDTEVRENNPGVIDIPIALREFLDARPLEVLGAEIAGERILLHLLLDPLSGAAVMRQTIALSPAASRSRGASPIVVVDSPAHVPFVDSSQELLPEVSQEITAIVLPLPEPSHLLAWIYGLTGLGGGIVIGVLLGYLLGL